MTLLLDSAATRLCRWQRRGRGAVDAGAGRVHDHARLLKAGCMTGDIEVVAKPADSLRNIPTVIPANAGIQ
ncbi:hypothetical protein IEQ11_14545 [Lysobacter capsici]|uniref:hypothetical protein n=1 Tax=Lysobacter capsici TaxID=435897 RepID=UPI001780125D|nr:hypothetical protein [Lysobacter capsici]UOF12979.1 hypothetical protein IEQ11_14545 [Lysobacter capsici]